MTPPLIKRLAFIDVLRGVAILTVVVHHLPESFAKPLGALQIHGGRGVDLFFVLSGFLIGSTCLNRADSGAGRIAQSKAYWVLRTLRIWPLYFPLLALMYLRFPLFHDETGDVLRVHQWPYLLFFSNDIGQPSLELGVLWSLAIEEQFYLVIGLVVLIASTSREALRAAFVAIGVTAIFVALRYRTDLIDLHYASMLPDKDFIFRLYFGTLSRIDQLGLGLLAAAVAPWFNAQRWANSAQLAAQTTWAAVCMVVLVIMYFPQRNRVEFTTLGVIFAVAVLWAQRPASRLTEPNRFERALVWLIGGAGKLSFGFYLFHPVVRRWIIALFERQQWDMGPGNVWLFLLPWVIVSAGVALVSYQFYELPILRTAQGYAGRAIQRVSVPSQLEDSAAHSVTDGQQQQGSQSANVGS